ncbi:DUF4097 family beta strand repeat-containing protein [Flavobacteriaceae bacterium KMM 6898]|nr:DUF4097 family beta strand repeat-containing protein [Flavobacteriaceae bacterium KMM 6898]
MKNTLLVILFFLCYFLNAQKTVKKTIVDPETSFIQIDAENCFEVILDTSNSTDLIVEAAMDGEYNPNLLVNVRQEGTTIFVSAGFHPNFIVPNDKLSAHKVISIALKINLPDYINAKVYGTSCNVTASGRYQSLNVILGDGRCTLKNVGENSVVRTQSGDIFLSTSKATITAISTYGEIIEELIPTGNDNFRLQTVTGNIHLKKTE